jgi:hypothetical protein
VTTLRLVLALVVGATASPALAAGVPLVDAGGAAHGAVVVKLTRGLVQLKIAGLATLPAPAADFTASVYKAYLFSSADPAVEIFLTDVFPNGKQRANRRIALGGDVSRLGLDRVAVTAFSSDGQKSFDVLTATLAP